MIVRLSKDGCGFQVEGEDDHVVTFRVERDEVALTGTFTGSYQDWDEIAKRIDDIRVMHEEAG
jgi:hypothetical protein